MPATIRKLRLGLKDYVERRELFGSRISILGRHPRTTSQKVLLFAHFNERSLISDLVMRLLEEYRSCGWSIVFITMMPLVSAAQIRKLSAVCDLIVHRRNFGLDFGAWCDVWPLVEDTFPEMEDITLTNDSVLGPITPISKVLDQVIPAESTIFGITDSFHHAYHIQSYFLNFRRGTDPNAPIPRAFLRVFFSNLRLSCDKDKIIRRGEFGITSEAIEAGFKVAVLCPIFELIQLNLERAQQEISELMQATRSAKTFATFSQITSSINRLCIAATINPTHYCWRVLIEKHKSPFLKTELLVRNPERLQNLQEWPVVVQAQGYLDPLLIRAHLNTL